MYLDLKKRALQSQCIDNDHAVTAFDRKQQLDDRWLVTVNCVFALKRVAIGPMTIDKRRFSGLNMTDFRANCAPLKEI